MEALEQDLYSIVGRESFWVVDYLDWSKYDKKTSLQVSSVFLIYLYSVCVCMLHAE